MEKQECPPPYYQPQQMPMPASAPDYHQQPPVIQPPPQTHVTNINVATHPTGGCPVCHQGSFKTSFTCCGWLCCIFCFPIGIICCLCMSKKKCSNCGFSAS